MLRAIFGLYIASLYCFVFVCGANAKTQKLTYKEKKQQEKNFNEMNNVCQNELLSICSASEYTEDEDKKKCFLSNLAVVSANCQIFLQATLMNNSDDFLFGYEGDTMPMQNNSNSLNNHDFNSACGSFAIRYCQTKKHKGQVVVKNERRCRLKLKKYKNILNTQCLLVLQNSKDVVGDTEKKQKKLSRTMKTSKTTMGYQVAMDSFNQHNILPNNNNNNKHLNDKENIEYLKPIIQNYQSSNKNDNVKFNVVKKPIDEKTLKKQQQNNVIQEEENNTQTNISLNPNIQVPDLSDVADFQDNGNESGGSVLLPNGVMVRESQLQRFEERYKDYLEQMSEKGKSEIILKYFAKDNKTTK